MLKSAATMFHPSSLLRLQRCLTLELTLLARGVHGATRFERADGCFGAFGFDAANSTVEFRIDPYSGVIVEVFHDPASWPEGTLNILPL